MLWRLIDLSIVCVAMALNARTGASQDEIATSSAPHYPIRISRVPSVLGVIKTIDADLDGIDDVIGWDGNWLTVLKGYSDDDFRLDSRQLLIASGSGFRDMTIVDLNLDGIDDAVIVVGPFGGPNSYGQVIAALGDGDGGFEPAFKQAFRYGLAQVVTGDFNGDGLPDVICRTDRESYSPNDPPPTPLYLLLGQGNGRFTPGLPIDVEGRVKHILAADFDGDHDIDLACARPVEFDIVVLRNNGVGVFDQRSELQLSVSPHELAVGDATGDGVIDLIGRGFTPSNDAVLLLLSGTPNGLSTRAIVSLVPVYKHLHVGDLNGDTIDDVVFESVECNYHSTAVLAGLRVALGTGDGTFAVRSGCMAVPWFTSIALHQSRTTATHDIFIATGDASLAVVPGRLDGSFDGLDELVGGAASNVDRSTLFDVDSDGLEDLLLIRHQVSHGIEIWYRDPNGQFRPPATVPFSQGGSAKSAIAAGDLNHDGLVDLAVGLQNAFVGLQIWLRLPSGEFGPSAGYFTSGKVDELRLADINVDGHLDIAARDREGSKIIVLLGDGIGAFTVAANISTPNPPDSIDLGDVDGDGIVDLLCGIGGAEERVKPRILVMHGLGIGSFVTQTIIPVDASGGSSVKILDLVDLDRDGDLDVVCAVSSTGPTSHAAVYRNDGAGRFGESLVLKGHFDVKRTSVRDVNADGRLDLAVWGSGATDLYLGRDDHGFDSPTTWMATKFFQLLDLDGDGFQDLVNPVQSRLLIGHAESTKQGLKNH